MTEVSGGRAIRPVILAGGAGTRLWPLSTIQRPKHLLPLLGNRTLFEQTLDRFGEQFSDPIIVANRAQEQDLRALARDGATAAGRELSTFRIAGAGPDHPVSSTHPEGRYLKVVFSRVP